MDLIISSSGKFIATYEDSKLTIYKDKLVFSKYELKLKIWELFDTCENNPVVINHSGWKEDDIEIIYKDGKVKKNTIQ